MREGFKAQRRRMGDTFWDKVFVGDGLDVSIGDADVRKEWYPKIKTVIKSKGRYWDDLRQFKPESFDFVNAGECLEHEASVFTAVLAWFRLLKVGGHMVITVPDFRLYESCQWPSNWNKDHKWSFSIPLAEPPHNRHINILEFVSRIPGVQIRRIHLADSGYNYSVFRVDQTPGEAEACIEVVLRKLSVADGRKRTYKHSGARGDLIYSLPAIMQLGGGTLYINRKKDHFFGCPVGDEEMAGIVEFLRTQTYIDDVQEWDSQTVDCDMDRFRDIDPAFVLLSEAYLMRFGVGFDLSKPWFDTSKIRPVSRAEIIVSRTNRYHSPFDWGELGPWLDRAAFVGLKEEHEEFVRKTGLPIRHEATGSWLELAGVILGSKLFVGNQSFSYSLAEAMKHPRVLEVCSLCPNCDPQSTNGHVRLSQGVIRKYLLGEDFFDVVRLSRLPNLQTSFAHKKAPREGYKNVSCVIVGNGSKIDRCDKELGAQEIETIISDRGTFEEAANLGAEKATRRIICIVDSDLCQSVASVAAVIDGMISSKSGLVASGTSLVGMPHVSGPCFAISRDAYEKTGLFNLTLRSGEAGMLDLVLRCQKLGIPCRSLGIPGWEARPSTTEDDGRNRSYMARNYGVGL